MSDGRELHDLHVLNLTLPEGQACWSQPAVLQPPRSVALDALARLHRRVHVQPARPKLTITHSCTSRSCEVVGRTLLFFGGGPANAITNGLTALDVPSRRWRVVDDVRGRLPRKRMVRCMMGTCTTGRSGGS